MSKRRIFVDKNGDVLALYDEKLGNITEYGSRTIMRASTVEFNNRTQKWEVRVPCDDALHTVLPEKDWTLVGSFVTRGQALEFEKDFVEELYKIRLKHGLTHGTREETEGEEESRVQVPDARSAGSSDAGGSWFSNTLRRIFQW